MVVWIRRGIGLVIAVATLAACGDDDGGGRPGEVSLDQIVSEVRVFTDTSRSTPANRAFAGSPERVLRTILWYAPEPLRKPACRGDRCGLLVLAHGFGGRAGRFDAVGQRLAAAGYIVAALTFPLTNQDAPSGQTLVDLHEQPGDMSFVVSGLLEAAQAPDDPLFGRIDAAAIGAVGHSMGGTSLLGASRTECCTDGRFVATAYVEPVAAPVVVEGFFGEPYAASGPPQLLFQGEVDVPVSPEDSRAFFATVDEPKILVEMAGGNHVNMIERFADEPDPLLEEAVEMLVAFFDAFLAGDDRIDAVVDRLRANGHTVRR